jgi:hypothetical protein
MKVCIGGASGKQYMVQHALDRGDEVVGVCEARSLRRPRTRWRHASGCSQATRGGLSYEEATSRKGRAGACPSGAGTPAT